MRVSRAGLALIEGFEGFVGHPYRDAVGVLTVGFGHTGADVGAIGTISRAQGEALLRRDLARYEAGVRAYVRAPLNQHQFDALVSFVYNLGPGVLPGSPLLAALNAGRYRVAADHMLAYCHAGGRVLPGLLARRKKERALFLETGDPKLRVWNAELASLRAQARHRKQLGRRPWTLAMRVRARRLKALIARGAK